MKLKTFHLLFTFKEFRTVEIESLKLFFKLTSNYIKFDYLKKKMC